MTSIGFIAFWFSYCGILDFLILELWIFLLWDFGFSYFGALDFLIVGLWIFRLLTSVIVDYLVFFPMRYSVYQLNVGTLFTSFLIILDVSPKSH